jgi:hypothetical protein
MDPITFDDFETFYEAMVEAALYTSTDEHYNIGLGMARDRSLQACGFDFKDLTERAHLILRAHALSFWSRMWYYLDHEKPVDKHQVNRAGRHFWCTSQGEGDGFWDGDWPVYGDMFTSLSKCYPAELNLEVTAEGVDLT